MKKELKKFSNLDIKNKFKERREEIKRQKEKSSNERNEREEKLKKLEDERKKLLLESDNKLNQTNELKLRSISKPPLNPKRTKSKSENKFTSNNKENDNLSKHEHIDDHNMSVTKEDLEKFKN